MYQGFRMVLGQYAGALRSVVRYISGVQLDRSMHGQKDGVAPFIPIPEDQQRKAMSLVAKYGFSPSAYSTSPEVYQHLQYQRRGWNFWGGTEDPKIMGRISAYQTDLLSHLLHPTILTRLNNSSYYGNTYSVAEMLNDVTTGIFAQDLRTIVNPTRQNLQITYVNGLISALNGGEYDNVSKSAVLYQLNSIAEMLKKNKSKNLETKAHREHVLFAINKALDND